MFTSLKQFQRFRTQAWMDIASTSWRNRGIVSSSNLFPKVPSKRGLSFLKIQNPINKSNFAQLSTCTESLTEIQEAPDKVLEKCQDITFIQTSKEALAQIQDEEENSLLMLAIKTARIAEAHNLIDSEVSLRHKNSRGDTAVHLAAKHGHLETIEKLFQYESLSEPNQQGKTPLFSAISAGQSDVVAALIENGVSSEERLEYKGIELSALAFAVMRGEIECVAHLAKKSSLKDHQCKDIGSLLHVAVHFQQSEVLKYLLKEHSRQCKDLLESRDSIGNTPFALGVIVDDPHALRLLELNGANIEPVNGEGHHPMHLAVLHNPHLIEYLDFIGCNFRAEGSGFIRPIDLAQEGSSERNFLLNLMKQTSRVRIAPPHYGYHPPENLAFKGGGPKGIAYLGALEILEQKKILPGIRRVAGTSAGAINSTLLAFNYTLEETRNLLTGTDLLDFIDQKALQTSLKNESSKTVTALRVAYQKIEEGWAKPTMNPIVVARNVFSSLNESGICDGENFRLWIEERIREKTKNAESISGIEYFTFGELKKAIRDGKPFKHLHVFVSNFKASPPITHISSEDLTDKWDDVIISDAVRASMSIPGVYKPHMLHRKINGKREAAPEFGIFVDGGLLNNLPVDAFDEKRYVQPGLSHEELRCPIFNKRTMGFSLKPESSRKTSEMETVRDLVEGMFYFFKEAEENIRQKNPYNVNRVIEIDNAGVKLMDFNLSPVQKRGLIDAGVLATEIFFERHKGKRVSGFYRPERAEKGELISLPEPLTHFIGREKELAEIYSVLQEERKVVIHGTGGVGKSELATKFADNYLRDYGLVWVLSVRTPESRMTSYLQLAKNLRINLEDSDTPEDIERKVHVKLERKQEKPWLLIYDDFNEPFALPSARQGHILMTSYSSMPNIHSIQIKPFDKKEAQELICNITKEKPGPAMDKLIELTGGYPFVLERIASYTSRLPGGTIEKYLEEFPDRNDLLRLEPNSGERYQKTRETVIAQTLQALPPKAQAWLRVCSYLDKTIIPKEYLESWLDLVYEEDRAAIRQSRNDILIALSEHEIQEEVNDGLYMPRLFHDALQLIEQGESLDLVSILLLEQVSWNLDASYREDLGKALVWNEQARAFMKHQRFDQVDQEIQAKILFALAEISKSIYQLQESLAFHQRAFMIRKEVYIEKHPDVAMSLDKIGGCYSFLGNTQEALQHQEMALKIREKIHGRNHPDVAVSLSNIGSCYYSHGKTQEALRHHKKALKIRKRVYGERHPEVASSLNHIGLCYSSQKNIKEALRNHEKALDIRKEVYGERHPEVARSLNNIGLCYSSQRNFQEAFRKYETAFEVRKEIYGERHPEVARSLNNIGLCYSSQGNFQEALKHHRKALRIRKEVYGERHPEVARSLNHIGLCYSSQGNIQEALKHHKKALRIRKEVYGENHPEMAKSLIYIGNCYSTLGKKQDAQECYAKADEIRNGIFV